MSLLEKQLNMFRMEHIHLLDGVSDSIAFVDRLGNFVFMNKTFKTIFNNGLDVIQIPIQKLFPKAVFGFNEKLDKFWSAEVEHQGSKYQIKSVRIERKGTVHGYWIIMNSAAHHANLLHSTITSKFKELTTSDIMDNLTDAVAILDAKQHIIYANKAFTALLGLSNSELLGKDSSLFIKGLGRIPSVTRKFKTELTTSDFDGELLDTTVHPIGKSSDKETLVIIKAADITRALHYKVKLLNSKLSFYQEQLERANIDSFKVDNIIGISDQIVSLKENIKKMSSSNCTVLLRGEKGVGKELFARAMHAEGPRSQRPFIKIKCSQLRTLGESSSLSQLAIADKGTVYFDEIADLELDMQKDLLEFVQTKKIVLGDGKERKLDIRIIVSAGSDLEDLVKKRVFSEKLYYRLNVLSFHIPPLRDRKEDILPLVNHFLSRRSPNLTAHSNEFSLSDEFAKGLLEHDWPGNIRELMSAIEVAIGTGTGPVLNTDSLPSYLRQPEKLRTNEVGRIKLKDILEETEKHVLLQTLQKTAGNKVKAAKVLGISRAGLYQKLEKHSLLDE